MTPVEQNIGFASMKLSWLETNSADVAMILLAFRRSFPKAWVEVRYTTDRGGQEGGGLVGNWYALNDHTDMTEIEVRLDQFYMQTSFAPDWYEVRVRGA